MQITETKIKVSELCQGYTDDGDGGVYGHDEKLLSIRVFSEQMKRRVYTKQTENAKANGTSNCPYCAKDGIDKIYAFDEM